MFEQNAPLVEIVGLTIGAHDLTVCDVCQHGLSNFMGALVLSANHVLRLDLKPWGRADNPFRSICLAMVASLLTPLRAEGNR